MKLHHLFLIPIILAACSSGIEDVPLQKRYKMAYALSVCSTMGLFVDEYKKNPLEKAWIYSQGITTVEKRDKFVLNLSKLGFRGMTNAYRIPSDFVPNPSSYSIEEISTSCPETYSDFLRIPF
jgi:hypothetical protein